MLLAAATLALAWSGTGASHLGAPSPDGRFLSGVHPDSGELLLRDLTTGIRRRVGRKTAALEHASYSVFAPDSRQIAFAWLNAERRYELRIASVDSLTERTLFRNDSGGLTQPCAFTPDSKQILTLLVRGPRSSDIAFISTETGAAKIVKHLEGEPPKRLSLSPDGRSISYRNSLLSADGSREEKLLMRAPDLDYAPIFSRDGRAVFILSKDEGLWRASLDDRKPVLVRAGLGRVFLQGITRESQLYFGLRAGAGNVYRATFDSAGAKLTSEPEAIGESEPPASLAAISGNFRANGKELWRSGGETPVAVFPRPITALAVAPDGETVAIAQSTTLTVLSPKGRFESRAAAETISGLTWTRNGMHLITVQNDSLWRWSPSLDSFRRMVKVQGSIGSVTLEPGDTAITFTAGRPKSEVWSMPVDAR